MRAEQFAEFSLFAFAVLVSHFCVGVNRASNVSIPAKKIGVVRCVAAPHEEKTSKSFSLSRSLFLCVR